MDAETQAEGGQDMSAKRFKPRDIADALLAGEAAQDSEFVRAEDYDALRATADADYAHIERLGALLRATAVALLGPEPPLTSWSWHDLSERVAALRAERDALRADAERYRWLRSRAIYMGVGVGVGDWDFGRIAASTAPNIDAAIDAARKEDKT
jgi:hypothetical protein